MVLRFYLVILEPDGPGGPDISLLTPQVIADVTMHVDGRTGENIYFCDVTSSSIFNDTWLYKVEWWLTTSRRQGVLLKEADFTVFTNKTAFNLITMLTEVDLIANDVIYVGYTVSVKRH